MRSESKPLSPMVEPWLRMTFKECPPDFMTLAVKARPYSPLLSSVVFLDSTEGRWGEFDYADVTVLVPPDLAADWASIDDTIAAEHMGEQILLLEYIDVCLRYGFLSAEDLYG